MIDLHRAREADPLAAFGQRHNQRNWVKCEGGGQLLLLSSKIASSPPRSAVCTRVRNQDRVGAGAIALNCLAFGCAPPPGVETVRIIWMKR